MLDKYHCDKPTHVRLEENYIKNVLKPLEEERERKLEEIRRQHQPIDSEDIEDHRQKYFEYKENLQEEHKKRDEEHGEMNSQLEQNLKDLYHSKFHHDIEPRFYNSAQVGRLEARKKIRDYSQEVLEKHRPRVDPLKRQKVRETILDLSLREDKSKVKVLQEDGSVLIKDRPSYDAYRIGVQYL
jgi:polyribonucleotide nucleotidyltransferase